MNQQPDNQVIVAPGGPMGLSMMGSAGMPSTPSGGGGFTPKDITQILRKRIWLILLSLVVFTIIAGVATWLWEKYAPLYTAHAQLVVQTSSRATEILVGPEEAIRPDMPEQLATHVRTIMQHETLMKATEDEEFRKTKWYQNIDKRVMIPELREIVRAMPIARTKLIQITVTMSDQNDAANIANAMARAYRDLSTDYARARLTEHITELKSRQTDLRTELESVRSSIEGHLRGARVVDVSERSSAKTDELAELNRQLLRMIAAKRQLKQTQDTLQQARTDNTLGEQTEIREFLRDDPNYSSLLMEHTRWTSMVRQYERTYGSGHNTVKEARGQLEVLARQMQEAEEQAMQTYMDRLDMEIAGVDNQIDELNDNIELVEQDVRELFLTLATLRQLRLREGDIANLLRRIDERLMGAQYRWELEVPIDVRGYAVPPTEPSQPQWMLMMIGGVIFGLLVGLGLAVLLEIVDTSIKKPSDIRRRMDLPLLGMVPHIDDLEEEIADPRLAMQTFPDSPVGEAFRQIRTRVVFSGPIDRQRTLMVTSPLPEDGRTTVTVNLAGAMAQGGSRVMLIDANFRQPMLHHLFEGASSDGLSNVLIGQTSWQQLTHNVDENLHVLSAGPLPPNPAELLASRQMRTLLKELTDHYDRVLFDTGPCLVVTDPCVLASEIDGVVMVYRAGANNHGVAQRARDAMLEANARILGAVLNGVRAMAGGYLRKNYEAFYDYRERQPLPAS